MPVRRVLVADDMTAVLSEVSMLLQDSFEIVDMVPDGRTALERTLALKPDIAVLDISMPGLSGIEVARELKRQHTTAKIVFLTVHDDPDIVKTCLEAGGLGYVRKVLIEQDLILALNEALEGRVFVSSLGPEHRPVSR